MADPVVWSLSYGHTTGLLDLTTYLGPGDRRGLNLRLDLLQQHLSGKLAFAEVLRASALQAGAVDVGAAQNQAIMAIKEYERTLGPGSKHMVSDAIELEALWYLAHYPQLIEDPGPQANIAV